MHILKNSSAFTIFLFFTSFCSLSYIYALKIILYVFIDATIHHYKYRSVYAYVYLYTNPLFMCLHLYMYAY